MNNRNLKHYIIDENKSLMDCLKQINRYGNQILFCTDDKGMITGSITDGDIRRALINKKPSTTPAGDIANRHFIHAAAGTAGHVIRKMMEQNSIRHIPVIENGILKDVVLYDSLIEKFIDVPVMIFAGGKGKRLRPLTANTPKPLLSIGGKSVIENIMEKMIAEGFADFRIALNYQPDKIIGKVSSRFGNYINEDTFIIEDKPMGTAGSLFNLKSRDASHIISYNADIISDINLRLLLNRHIKMNNDITCVLIPMSYAVPFGVASVRGNVITSLSEKPVKKDLIMGGINVFNINALSELRCRGRCDMSELIEKAISKGMRTGYFIHDGFWTDIGEIETYNAIDNVFGGGQ